MAWKDGGDVLEGQRQASGMKRGGEGMTEKGLKKWKMKCRDMKGKNMTEREKRL